MSIQWYISYWCMYQQFYYRVIDSIQCKGDRVFKYENSCKKIESILFPLFKTAVFAQKQFIATVIDASAYSYV